jgi:uncharacterized protein with HEPN domain
MSPTRNPRVRLSHIRDELAWVIPAYLDWTYERFLADIAAQRAVAHALLIVSEAAKALPVELRAQYPQVPWHAVTTIGNFLRHDYDEVVPQTLWRTLTKSLPELEPVIARMIADLDR